LVTNPAAPPAFANSRVELCTSAVAITTSTAGSMAQAIIEAV